MNRFLIFMACMFSSSFIFSREKELKSWTLKNDPSELKNEINNARYDEVKAMLHKQLEVLQVNYKVKNKVLQAITKNIKTNNLKITRRHRNFLRSCN